MNPTLIKLFTGRIARNLYFWSFLLVFPLVLDILTTSSLGIDTGHPIELSIDHMIANIIVFSIIAPLVYLNNLLLMPMFLAKRQYRRYFFWLGVLVFIGTFSWWIMKLFVISYIVHVPSLQPGFGPFLRMGVAVSLFIIGFAASKLAFDWMEKREKQGKLTQQQLSSELKFLKNQVNPHFLFNVLNTLYGLARQEKAPKTAEMSLKLSQMMRYLLHDSQRDWISLETEIGYIRHYVELEKLRKPEGMDISLDIQGESNGKKIAPMLLIPFVENAFKHGMDNQSEGAWLHIGLVITPKSLHFRCDNSYSVSQGTILPEEGGIGLANVERRLALRYPKHHELKIDQQPDRFVVELEIKL